MIKGARLAFGSWSTFGQTALLIIGALLVAQVLAFFLVRSVIDEWQASYVVQPTIRRFADVAKQVQAAPSSRREQILYAMGQAGEELWLDKDVRFGPRGRQEDLEKDLSSALKKRGVAVSAVLAIRHSGFDRTRGSSDFTTLRGSGGGFVAAEPWFPQSPGVPVRLEQGARSEQGGRQPMPGLHAQPDQKMLAQLDNRPPDVAYMRGLPREWHPLGDGPPLDHTMDEIRLAALMSDGQWLVGRFIVLKPFPLFLSPIFVSQVALFVILLGGTLFWASRISRPLRILSRAAEVLHPQEQFEPIPVQGPRDVQVAINSFNTMALRVRELLQEKDRMLSAIGHDLRTPLASLRIRVESVEPEAEREKFVETIDEMTAMVEEILDLTRLGHSTEPRQLVDLSAFADSVVEEFHELGGNVVFLESPRAPVLMQVGLVRRLLRNLIDNAVKYGAKAQISVRIIDGFTELIVEDEGPGIPPERLSEVLQPFTRLDTSRSRSTGGTGLGLSIADAVAQSQGATLILENRVSGGLQAIVKWPMSDQGVVK